MGKHRAIQPIRNSNFIREQYAAGKHVNQIVDAIRDEFGLRINRWTVRQIMAEQGIEWKPQFHRRSKLSDEETLRRVISLTKKLGTRRAACKALEKATGISAGGVQSQAWRAKAKQDGII